jgi:hypothetical protein
MDWRTAYLRQAQADYAMLLKLLGDADVPLCQQLHYLQMTTEKLAKGLLTPPGGERYPNTHNGFAKFVSVAKCLREIRRACGFRQAGQFIAYVDSLRPLAQAVEDLSPEGGDHPNPEYPWEVNGVVVCPTEYAFPALDLGSPKMIKLLRFIDDCFTIL